MLKGTIIEALRQSPNYDLKGTYVEPYFGGGAVFFAKEPHHIETINDINDNLVTFYRVAKDKEGFAMLKSLLEGTLHARSTYELATRILKGDEEADDLARAWAVFTHLNMAFGHGWGRGYGFVTSYERGGARRKRGFCEQDTGLHRGGLRPSALCGHRVP